MPRFLGMFETPHAGFVEVFDREDGGKDLYLTTFNPALPFFHDPVFFLRDPGIVSQYHHKPKYIKHRCRAFVRHDWVLGCGVSWSQFRAYYWFTFLGHNSIQVNILMMLLPGLITLKHLEPKPLLIGQISQFRFQKRCWDLKPWSRLLGSLFLEKQMERLSCLTHQLVLKVRDGIPIL